MKKTKKKVNGAKCIMKKEKIKEMYEGVFKAVEHAVEMNICLEDSVVDGVIIKNENKEVARIVENETDDILRSIKKIFIKHKLFPIEMELKDETLIVYTTQDIWKLMYVPSYDTEAYYLEEFNEIKAEIEQEDLLR